MTPPMPNSKSLRGRRLAVLVLLPALLALTLFCILRMPCDPRRLHQCVPSSAVLVSAHHNLAARYEELATNAFLRPMLQAAGLNPANLSPANARRLRYCAPYIAGRETLMAWAPRMHGNGQPGLILVSWMGRAGLAARWWLELRAPAQLQRQPAYAGHSIWMAAQPVNPAGWRLAFAIHEGILIALVSPDPAGIKEVIQTAERLRRPADALANPDFLALPPETADRFWLRQPGAAAAVNAIKPGLFSAAIHAAAWLPSDTASLQPADLQPMANLLGDRPVMAAVLPARSAGQLLSLHPALQEWDDLLLTPPDGGRPDGALGLALLTGGDGGGLGLGPWRISIPALIGFIPIRNPAEGQAMVKQTLDRLNASYKLGLIADAGANLPDQATAKIFTIEPTTDNFLARLAPEDRPAYAILDRWLLFSSNAGALARRFAPPPQDGQTSARWHQAASAAPCAGMLWLDLPRAIPAIQSGLTAWTLHLRAPGRVDPPGWLQILRQWLDELRVMETACIRLMPGQPTVLVDISAGKDAD